MQRLGALDDVADDARVVRDRDPERVLGGHRGGVTVRDRADAADALRDVEGVRGRAALQDRLHAAVQTAGDPCVLDDAVLDFDLDAQVTLDAGDRVDDVLVPLLIASLLQPACGRSPSSSSVGAPSPMRPAAFMPTPCDDEAGRGDGADGARRCVSGETLPTLGEPDVGGRG